ncbi:MAG: hypothetical protein IKJ56_00635 [Bacteroidales bacterium]|nr:hypothetical protein [Bacteroidales bacterium]
MLDLAQFIKMKLDMPCLRIYKHFSDPVRNEKDIPSGMWAWDFLYSYQLEYDFEDKQYGQYKYAITLLQCVDTGYFDIEDNDKKFPDTFAAEEYSESKLVFYVNRIQNGSEWKQWYKRQELFDTKKYMCKDFKNKVIDYPENNEKVLLYSFPIERFIDEQSTIEALQEFVEYCNDQLDLNVILV